MVIRDKKSDLENNKNGKKILLIALSLLAIGAIILAGCWLKNSKKKSKKVSYDNTIEEETETETESDKLKLDDISELLLELNQYDLDTLSAKMENDALQKKYLEALEKRPEIFNKFLDEKKSFILIVGSKGTDEAEYTMPDDTKKILAENNYQYVYAGRPSQNSDTILSESKLKDKTIGSVVIFKEGEIIDQIDEDAFLSEKEIKDWLRTYITVE
ncbi:MAG: hypothetical protein K6G26_07000 [Lachnospiraceae bacterium]|nr:hypothetical protein [Lachnospiraceae bacterium]